MLITVDNHVWPPWAPAWLGAEVESPDCSSGTHPALRNLAKWLVVYFAEHEGQAERWLHFAAQRCDRDVDDGEIDRLLAWAEALVGSVDPARTQAGGETRQQPPRADLEEIYRLAVKGPRLTEYRAASPVRLCDTPRRNTELVLEAGAEYAGIADPLVCFGSRDTFWTRPKSAVGRLLYIYEQIVPSPMRAIGGITADGRWSEHTKDGTCERTFLVVEFDFAPLTPKGKPTIWTPLLERGEAARLTILDINAALLVHLAAQRPLWMTVFSGSKSLQGWFPCRDVTEEELHDWFNRSARVLGADPMTFCKSQFVRMPDGHRGGATSVSQI
jgi:hypothetical protein